MKILNISAILCVALLSGVGFADAQTTPDFEHAIAVSPTTPDKMTFANQVVSFDRVDMAERMDRELISFVYGHTNTLLTIKRANRYFPEIISILKEEGVPVDFIYLAAIESFFDNRAVSYTKASGIWQIMPTTGKEYGLEINSEVDERYDCEKATRAACKYFKRAYAKYGCWITVASSYNAGTGRISKELERQYVNNSFDLYLNQETSRYLFRLLAMKRILENPKEYGFILNAEQLYQPISYTTKVVDSSISDWAEWAGKEGITYAQLREMNPWIKAVSLTNPEGKKYSVRIPNKKDLYRSTRHVTVYNRNWIIR